MKYRWEKFVSEEKCLKCDANEVVLVFNDRENIYMLKGLETH